MQRNAHSFVPTAKFEFVRRESFEQAIASLSAIDFAFNTIVRPLS